MNYTSTKINAPNGATIEVISLPSDFKVDSFDRLIDIARGARRDGFMNGTIEFDGVKYDYSMLDKLLTDWMQDHL